MKQRFCATFVAIEEKPEIVMAIPKLRGYAYSVAFGRVPQSAIHCLELVVLSTTGRYFVQSVLHNKFCVQNLDGRTGLPVRYVSPGRPSAKPVKSTFGRTVKRRSTDELSSRTGTGGVAAVRTHANGNFIAINMVERAWWRRAVECSIIEQIREWPIKFSMNTTARSTAVQACPTID